MIIKKFNYLFLLLIFLCCSSFAGSYKVQVGDLIRISLSGEPSLEDPFEVDRLGRIMLPEVGAVSVAGLSEEVMESRVSEN